MIAFVLSGGGNRGPIQVGALEALFECGVRPDFLVGTSAGAINAAYVAAMGVSPACIEGLAASWHQASRHAVYGGNALTMAWRVLQGRDSLYSPKGLRRLVEQNLPEGVTTFGDLKLPCYLTAVDLRSGRLYLFGEYPDAPLVDAILASSSVPGLHPPVEYAGLQLVDGGVVAATPSRIAMEKGATTLYAINVSYGGEVRQPAQGVLAIVKRTLDTFTAQSLLADLDRATSDAEVDLHHIHISAFEELPFNDFDHVDEMISAGKVATMAYLSNPQPRMVRSLPPHQPIRREVLHAVPGARGYTPRP